MRCGSFTPGNMQTPNADSRDYAHKQYDMSKSNMLVQQATGISHY